MAGTEAEVMERHCLLGCLPWLAQFPFLYYPGLPTSGSSAPALHGLALQDQLVIKKNVYRQSDVGYSSKEVPFPG